MYRPEVPDDRQTVRTLKALAHPKRFQMFQEIAAAGELSCGQIGEKFPLSQPTISHHLKILHEAGLLAVREQGQHHFISVNRTLVRNVLGMLQDRLASESSGRSSEPRMTRRGDPLRRTRSKRRGNGTGRSRGRFGSRGHTDARIES